MLFLRGHIAVSDELTDRAYWERTWNDANIPMSVDLTDHGIRNHATLTVHRYFETVLCAFRRRQTSLIELGCAQSKWLPYFARHWRFDVAGLDFSELGCQRARQMLAASGVTGEIVYGDLFSPPREMLERYEIVFSQGLVEHFKDTASAIAACAAFVKPGGTILTIIPNLVGIVGVLQSALDHKVYDAHVPMDVASLARQPTEMQAFQWLIANICCRPTLLS